jgi:molecular chaperone GrpE (heat shock protein)
MSDEFDRPDDIEANMPELDIPDGIGLSYEDLAVLFAMKNETAVSKKDPVMIMVTVCNAFLEKARQLHDQHNEALTKILTAKTQDYITSVKTTTDAFTTTLSQASVEGIRKIFEEHASELHSAKWNFRWCALIVAVSALANVIILACK